MIATRSAAPGVGRSWAAADREDARFLARVCDLDVRAFELLYKRYHSKLLKFATNMVRRPHLADEVVNDAMMVVWRKAKTFDESSRVSTWIYGIAYRTSLAAMRRFDVPVDDETLGEQVALTDDPDHVLDLGMAKARLEKAMLSLSTAHRTVVELTYTHEMSYHEIAGIMNCPVDTVKTRMFHARRHLKQVLAGSLQDWL